MNAVGKNLKQLRQREKLTQDALAERLHVTRQAVSSWETGKTQPDIETLTALAEALGADVRELIYGPERVERPYTRFQRRYIICAAVCVLILLAWAVMEWTLRPYLWRRRAEMFETLSIHVLYVFGSAYGLYYGGRSAASRCLSVEGHPPGRSKTADVSAGAGPAGADPTTAGCHSVFESVARFYGELPFLSGLGGAAVLCGE